MKKKAIEYSITAKKQDFELVKIQSSNDASMFARKFYHEDILIYESAFIMLMNRANNVMGYAKISQGGVCGTPVDVRLVAKYAVECLASGVIFVHNHPSGNASPSVDDKRISERLRDALRLFDIRLFDSIIITDNDYFSMVDEGLIY